MAKAEVEGAEKEILEVLPARAAKIDTFMAKALSQEMKVHGMTFKDVEAHGGNVHLGNAYAPGEKSTGNDNHVFEKLRFGGDANFHGGNSYGMGREVRAPEPR